MVVDHNQTAQSLRMEYFVSFSELFNRKMYSNEILQKYVLPCVMNGRHESSLQVTIKRHSH
jgi:hypothetical protein